MDESGEVTCTRRTASEEELRPWGQGTVNQERVDMNTDTPMCSRRR
jgi:hypothetical protein